MLSQPSASALDRARFLAAVAVVIPDIYAQSLEAPADGDAQELSRRQVVRAITQFIDKNPGGDLSLDHLARLAGYSKFHFVRMFQRYHRCSLATHINQVKVRRAIELFRGGSSATTVSDALGFSSPSSFHRFFHRQTGKRPSDFYAAEPGVAGPLPNSRRNPLA